MAQAEGAAKRPRREYRVAVIGGGICGSVCASHLSREAGVHVTLFDQGRGLGGRGAHRRVDVAKGSFVSPMPTVQDLRPSGAADEGPGDPPAVPFLSADHGAQFFRADDGRMLREVESWVSQGWASAWHPRVTVLRGSELPEGSALDADFFGINRCAGTVYTGNGGFHRICYGLVDSAARDAPSRVRVLSGARVAGMQRDESGRWSLSGPPVGHSAAFHDTKEETARGTAHAPLVDESFDAVVVTDVSASFGEWHRASAGVPERIARAVRRRVRVALFTAVVAFRAPLDVGFDAATVAGDGALWFAARNGSKEGLRGFHAPADVWTLVSTAAYAVAEIERVPMRDPATGAFRPQGQDYLRKGPCEVLLRSFADAARRSGGLAGPLPEVLHVSGQRWGSAMPAPAGVGGRDSDGRAALATRGVLGTDYETAAAPPVMADAEGEEERLIFEDAADGVVYAGDYCSNRRPGFETAALSGMAAAAKVLAWAAA